MALAITAVWTAITIGGGVVQDDGDVTLEDLVSYGILWPVPAAAAFLLAATLVLRWWGIGLTPPDWLAALRLQWLPLLYIAAFLTVAVLVALPAPVVVLWVLVNTLLIGISEEWMFRGILFKALSDRFSLWPAVWLSSAIFGAVHSLNGFASENPGAALCQSAAAAVTGILFCAIRVRTGSIYPAMLTHGLWDFGIFLMSSALITRAGALQDPMLPPRLAAALPILLVLPNLIFGIWLLRGGGQKNELDGDGVALTRT